MIHLRLVLDTNIVVSAALKPAGLQRTVLILALRKPARLYLSAPIFAEYRAVLSRAELHIRKGLRPAASHVRSRRQYFPGMRRRRPRRLLNYWQSAPFSKVLEENKNHHL